jgi:ABC-type nitrate/sulfonate/bicarbonate transport system substrate-binding protein
MLIALPYPTMTFLPLFVAEEKGFFAAEGVSAYCVQVQSHGGQSLAQLVESGEVAFLTSLTNAMEAVLGHGHAIKFLCATTLTKFPCVVRPAIRSIADLKGKRVMSGGGRSNTDLRFLCARYGLRPDTDLEVVKGDSVGRAKAFEDPTIAAVFARSQFLYWGTKAGFQPLNYPEPGMGWYEGGLAAGVSLLTRQADLVQKVVTAVVRATAFLKENEKEAIDVALKRIPNLDRAEAEGNYRILRAGFVDNLEPSVIDYMSKVVGTIKGSSRQVTLEDVADVSFLHEAQRRATS